MTSCHLVVKWYQPPIARIYGLRDSFKVLMIVRGYESSRGLALHENETLTFLDKSGRVPFDCTPYPHFSFICSSRVVQDKAFSIKGAPRLR